MIAVKDVQARLPEYWNDKDYPDGFNGGALPHRHFNHALSHAMKALGGLASLSDAMDHDRMGKFPGGDPEAEQFSANAGKWLADLVICASRMAEQHNVNLDEAVQSRIDTLIARWGGK